MTTHFILGFVKDNRDFGAASDLICLVRLLRRLAKWCACSRLIYSVQTIDFSTSI